jgi:uncharacterized protein (TIGR02646 family)
MQFIKRSACPPLLATNQVEWTRPWVVYYSIGVHQVLPTKPEDNHWLKDEIRLPLIDDFHNNCGYCGDSISTPENDTPQKKVIPKGDVEHFLPKAIYPEQVYEWTNYIWSCKECNQLKANKETQKSYNPNYLNPCHQDDCEKLIFNEDTGRYVLQDDFANDDWWQERLRNSELKTMLNSEQICAKRQLKIGSLRRNFESIARFLPLLNNGANFSSILQKQIDDSRTEILAIMDSLDFYLLLQDSYQSFCQEYPLVKSNLESIAIY